MKDESMNRSPVASAATFIAAALLAFAAGAFVLPYAAQTAAADPGSEPTAPAAKTPPIAALPAKP